MAIDLRSDTVTLPSPAMRQAMARADVGDDVFGEDPTINTLEARVAEMAGKDAAVFVPSGTMGNLASLLAHCSRGQEAILGDESHIFHYEAGGASALGGIVFHPVRTEPDGTLPLDDVERSIRGRAEFLAPPGVVCIENTHNRCSGALLAPDYVQGLSALAARHNLPLHLDGARLFNAAVATGLPLTAWTAHAATVSLCLSKGLAAPAGSLVAGSTEIIQKVRRARKILGGGMRQAGVLAAAGLVAIDQMIERLAEDHANAKLLANGLAAIDGITIDAASVATNIVIFGLNPGLDSAAFVAETSRQGVRLIDMGHGRLRAVTHYGITDGDCERAISVCAQTMAEIKVGDR